MTGLAAGQHLAALSALHPCTHSAPLMQRWPCGSPRLGAVPARQGRFQTVLTALNTRGIPAHRVDESGSRAQLTSRCQVVPRKVCVLHIA